MTIQCMTSEVRKLQLCGDKIAAMICFIHGVMRKIWEFYLKWHFCWWIINRKACLWPIWRGLTLKRLVLQLILKCGPFCNFCKFNFYNWPCWWNIVFVAVFFQNVDQNGQAKRYYTKGVSLVQCWLGTDHKIAAQ